MRPFIPRLCFSQKKAKAQRIGQSSAPSSTLRRPKRAIGPSAESERYPAFCSVSHKGQGAKSSVPISVLTIPKESPFVKRGISIPVIRIPYEYNTFSFSSLTRKTPPAERAGGVLCPMGRFKEKDGRDQFLPLRFLIKSEPAWTSAQTAKPDTTAPSTPASAGCFVTEIT